MCFVVSKMAGWEAACCQCHCCVNSFFRHLFVLPVSLMHPCYGCIMPTKTSRNFGEGIWSYISLQEQWMFFNWYLNLKPNHDLQPHRPPLLALYLSSFPRRTWALSRQALCAGSDGAALLQHCLPPAAVGSSGDVRRPCLDDACVGVPRILPLEFVQGQVLSEQGFTLHWSHVVQKVESWGRLWHVDKGQR